MRKKILTLSMALALSCGVWAQNTNKISVGNPKAKSSNKLTITMDGKPIIELTDKERKEIIQELNKIRAELKANGEETPPFIDKIEQFIQSDELNQELFFQILAEAMTAFMTTTSEGVSKLMPKANISGVDSKTSQAIMGLLNTNAQKNEKGKSKWNVSPNTVAAITQKLCSEQPNATPNQLDITTLTEEQVVIAPVSYSSQVDFYIKEIELGKDTTRVTLLQKINGNPGRMLLTSTSYLMDVDDNSCRYPLIGTSRNVPIDQVYGVINHPGEMMEITMLFPPVKNPKKVKNMVLSLLPNSKIHSKENQPNYKHHIDVANATRSNKELVIRQIGTYNAKYYALFSGKGYLLSELLFNQIEIKKYKGQQYYMGYNLTNQLIILDAQLRPVNEELKNNLTNQFIK